MEKQVSSNTESVTQDRYNKVTVFLTKFMFGDKFEMLRKLGFVDSYTQDPQIMNILTLGQNQRLLFLLFKNKKLGVSDIKRVILELASVPIQVVFSYELINDYLMIVIDFPESFTQDYDHIVKGKFSKLSQPFRDQFPVSVDVVNEKGYRVGREYTLYYHIFNKTEWLKNFWMERLGLCELDDKLELWHSPDEKDLVFNLKTLMK